MRRSNEEGGNSEEWPGEWNTRSGASSGPPKQGTNARDAESADADEKVDLHRRAAQVDIPVTPSADSTVRDSIPSEWTVLTGPSDPLTVTWFREPNPPRRSESRFVLTE